MLRRKKNVIRCSVGTSPRDKIFFERLKTDISIEMSADEENVKPKQSGLQNGDGKAGSSGTGDTAENKAENRQTT